MLFRAMFTRTPGMLAIENASRSGRPITVEDGVKAHFGRSLSPGDLVRATTNVPSNILNQEGTGFEERGKLVAFKTYVVVDCPGWERPLGNYERPHNGEVYFTIRNAPVSRTRDVIGLTFGRDECRVVGYGSFEVDV